jgi:hypothetical protein
MGDCSKTKQFMVYRLGIGIGLGIGFWLHRIPIAIPIPRPSTMISCFAAIFEEASHVLGALQNPVRNAAQLWYSFIRSSDYC